MGGESDDMSPTTDWSAWHADYADPTSLLSERLRVVQRHIHHWLDESAPDPVTVVRCCAGDGRDILEVLSDRGDSERVSATLLEGDPRNARRASGHIRRLGLSGIEVRCTDAGSSDAYAHAVPADLVLLCGIFGNIAEDDVHRTIAAAPQFCKPDAVVIWTRHRKEPDLTPSIRRWFSDHGFAEVDFVAPEHAGYSVGVNRLVGDPQHLVEDQHLFRFVR